MITVVHRKGNHRKYKCYIAMCVSCWTMSGMSYMRCVYKALNSKIRKSVTDQLLLSSVVMSTAAYNYKRLFKS